MWNCGLQMVALNYQTPDKAMQLNEAMFMQNGKSGYVLKPQYMFDDTYNPYEKPSEIHNFNPLVLTVRVIGARHLKKALKGIVSPSIEIEMIGVEVYPKGSRLDSSNYDPIRMWNCGLQMVALNYQTPDKAMQLNEAMFMQNGKSGYVLKPQYMFDDTYNPYEKPSEIHNFNPLVLTVRVIGARHLKKALKGIVSPSIEIEMIGVEYDCRKCLTRVVHDNGLNPVWSRETFVFNIVCPELALIRFLVSHLDTFDDSSFVGHSTIPVTCLRSGYRSVQLKNEFSEELDLSTLLIYMDIKRAKDTIIKTSVGMLKYVYENLCKMIVDSKTCGNEEEVKRFESLREKVTEKLKNKTEETRFVNLELNNRNEMKIINELSICKMKK
ncbi:unnamed protein product [Oppiella nova]|uniref:Phosphoinositide phospholipase C n=1 Tax=Oppiella nova TaxID=334625 RepID=A0A7R9ME55_9ACAR|nr:unnamed protein product [Oppiella nova]CAG2175667.1 unnamed protein product [Oppiella nova]